MWNCSSPSPVLQYTFECNQGAVLSIAVRGETIYAGCQDGYIKILDLETRTLVRTIIVREVNSRVIQANGALTEAVERRGSFPLSVALRSLQRVGKRPDSGGRKVVSAESLLKYHQRWSASFDCTAESDGHTDSIILSSVVTYSEESGQFQLVTGANDGYIKVRARIPLPTQRPRPRPSGMEYRTAGTRRPFRRRFSPPGSPARNRKYKRLAGLPTLGDSA